MTQQHTHIQWRGYLIHILLTLVGFLKTGSMSLNRSLSAWSCGPLVSSCCISWPQSSLGTTFTENGSQFSPSCPPHPALPQSSWGGAILDSLELLSGRNNLDKRWTRREQHLRIILSIAYLCLWARSFINFIINLFKAQLDQCWLDKPTSRRVCGSSDMQDESVQPDINVIVCFHFRTLWSCSPYRRQLSSFHWLRGALFCEILCSLVLAS